MYDSGDMDKILFTVPESIALLGVFQCVYVLIYVVFRAGDFARVIIPVLYFFVLGFAFLTDLARSFIAEIFTYYDVISWVSWISVIPLSALLIIQMANITRIPSILNWTVLLTVPIAFVAANIWKSIC